MADDEIKTENDVLVVYGGEVKALEGGKVAGYLVRYTSADAPDLTGDYFAADTDLGDAQSSPVYYHHGLDAKMGKRVIGRGSLNRDDVGVWIEAQLDMRDDYEKAIYEMAQAGKLGWSSGTASHLVERRAEGKAQRITKWPLGLDASLTPTPAEPRNTAVPLKSLTSIPEADEAGEDKPAVDEDVIQSTEPEEKDNLMEDELKSQIDESVKTAVKAAVEAMTPTNTAGIVAAKSAPAVIESTGDTGTKAFVRWARTGDVSSGLKSENPWNEGTAGDGAVLVPDDFYERIIAKAAESSIMRQAGALQITTSRDKITIPVENDAMAAFVSTAEESGTFTITETTPLTQKDIAMVKYTRMVKVSNELLSDAVVSIENFLTMQLANAKALTENSIFLTGSGDGDPAVQGIFSGGTAGLTLDSATAIGVSEIPELFFKLNAAYADRAVWVMKHATLGYIRSLRDEYNFAYMANPQGQLNGGLMGKPVYVSDQCAAIGGGYKSIAVGDPSQYCIADSQGMIVSRNPYLYQANDLTGFFAKFRLGAAVLQAEAWQYATHPTA